MAFPTQPVVDSCVRADESPLSLGGLWVDGGFASQFRITSNQLATTGSTAVSGWVNISTSADVEVYLSMPTTVASGESIWLLCRCSASASLTVNCYLVTYDGATSHLALARFDAGAYTSLSYDGIPPTSTGIGLSATGSVLQPWYFDSGAWLNTIPPTTDSTYGAAGYFTLFSNGGTTGRFTNIGLGPASSVPPGGGSGVFSGSAVPSSHSLDRGMYKALARGIAR